MTTCVSSKRTGLGVCVLHILYIRLTAYMVKMAAIQGLLMAFAFSLGFYQLILLETLKSFIYISNRVLSSQRIMFCVTEISYNLNPSVRITTVRVLSEHGLSSYGYYVLLKMSNLLKFFLENIW